MRLFDHARKVYIGPRDPQNKTLPKVVRRGIWIYYAQRARSGTEYSLGEFLYWWKFSEERGKIFPTSHAHVGRKDHSKPYSFDNILIQTIKENSIERNDRLGNPGVSHRAVVARFGGKEKVFPSKTAAAKFFNIDPKTIWNRCEGRSVETNNGPKNDARDVVFSWK